MHSRSLKVLFETKMCALPALQSGHDVEACILESNWGVNSRSKARPSALSASNRKVQKGGYRETGMSHSMAILIEKLFSCHEILGYPQAKPNGFILKHSDSLTLTPELRRPPGLLGRNATK